MGIPRFSVVVLALCCGIAQANAQSDEEIGDVLEKLFSPESAASIHARALRRDIARRLYDALRREDLEDALLGYKRSLGAPGKRNLAALAKGGYIRTIPASEEQQEQEQEQQQQQQEQEEQGKRSLASLARNGELHGGRRDLRALIDALREKRHLASLARSYSLPAANVAAGKRNVAALLRQDKIHGPNDRAYELAEAGGGGAASGYKPPLEGGARARRAAAAAAEYAAPVYQGQDGRDYEELMRALTGEYPPDKRFLGRLPQMGKSKTTPSPKTNYE